MRPSLAMILCICMLLCASAVAAEHAGVVNLNEASAEQLERLPGIGPSRARAILELRARLKRFTRIEDLLRVKGIGRATFRKLRPLVTLDGPTTLSLNPGGSISDEAMSTLCASRPAAGRCWLASA